MFLRLISFSFIFILFAPLAASLERHNKLVQEDLKKLNIPAKSWVVLPSCICGNPPLDVAIIGGGMSGNTIALALLCEGIVNICIFDANKFGEEGSWNTYARMKQLRSNKMVIGPAKGIPSLTFQSWYEATRGVSAWNVLGFIPTQAWSDYLRWYQHVLSLPVMNEMKLKMVKPIGEWLELTFDHGGVVEKHVVRKVVFATGMEGFGGSVMPSYMDNVPKHLYATAYEEIDPAAIAEKRVVVVGAGSSAFDATAFSLENGASRVDMVVRRKKIPTVNKFIPFGQPNMQHGFYFLSDEVRCSLFAEALSNGIPPPRASLDRIAEQPNFHAHLETEINEILVNNAEIKVVTNHETYEVDFIILATGFAVNGSKREELQDVVDAILLWGDKAPELMTRYSSKLALFPYLGPHFQFLERDPGQAPYLKHLYCFNYGAFLSHGLITSNINGLSIGAERLARGIASDFLSEDLTTYFPFFDK